MKDWVWLLVLLAAVATFVVGVQVDMKKPGPAQPPVVVTLRDAADGADRRYRCDRFRIREVSGAPTVFCTQGKYEYEFYGYIPMRVDRVK